MSYIKFGVIMGIYVGLALTFGRFDEPAYSSNSQSLVQGNSRADTNTSPSKLEREL